MLGDCGPFLWHSYGSLQALPTNSLRPCHRRRIPVRGSEDRSSCSPPPSNYLTRSRSWGRGPGFIFIYPLSNSPACADYPSATNIHYSSTFLLSGLHRCNSYRAYGMAKKTSWLRTLADGLQQRKICLDATAGIQDINKSMPRVAHYQGFAIPKMPAPLRNISNGHRYVRCELSVK